jgi:phosphopantetheinyl transferase (holo-ACP synthase)
LPLVGNDVVDLLGKGNVGKYEDWRFIERVFSSNEQKMIFNHSYPDAMLWALWGGKEAAYKVEKKFSPKVNFVPSAYAVNLYGGCKHSEEKRKLSKSVVYFTGTVETPKRCINIEIMVTSDFINCLGVYGEPQGGKPIIWEIDDIYQKQQTGNCNDESLLVREAARKSLASYLNCNPERIEIRRKQKMSNLGPPFVYFDGKPAEIDVTLSHDGRYVAYAFTCFN